MTNQNTEVLRKILIVFVVTAFASLQVGCGGGGSNASSAPASVQQVFGSVQPANVTPQVLGYPVSAGVTGYLVRRGGQQARLYATTVNGVTSWSALGATADLKPFLMTFPSNGGVQVTDLTTKNVTKATQVDDTHLTYIQYSTSGAFIGGVAIYRTGSSVFLATVTDATGAIDPTTAQDVTAAYQLATHKILLAESEESPHFANAGDAMGSRVLALLGLSTANAQSWISSIDCTTDTGSFMCPIAQSIITAISKPALSTYAGYALLMVLAKVACGTNLVCLGIGAAGTLLLLFSNSASASTVSATTSSDITLITNGANTLTGGTDPSPVSPSEVDLSWGGTYIQNSAILPAGPNAETDSINGYFAGGTQSWSNGEMTWSGVLDNINPQTLSTGISGSGTFTWWDNNGVAYPSPMTITSGGLSWNEKAQVFQLCWGSTGPFGPVGGCTVH